MHPLLHSAQCPPQVTLANGLRVRLLPLPHNSQAAVLVRVHAGSHDAPREYPGLAHFLEHLLFLGSRDYPAAQSLMPFVQGCGGQLNASTRERHTDFFFQLPSDQLEEGLRRLLDMLAHPLLDSAAQLREREVLQAEFRARAQDVETLCDAALSTVFEPDHPFADFHAGNRDTLPVENAQFQQALLGYHRCFYHSGQIELLLTGQDAEELQRLAVLADDSLAPGSAVIRVAPALRCDRDRWLRLQLDKAQPRLHLAFALNDLPEHCAPALDYLSTWVASETPGGLVQRLRGEELCQSVKLRVPYWYVGQGVAIIELLLTERGLGERAQIVEAVLDWLRFFSNETCWQSCHEEYRRIRQRSLLVADPLMRLRHWVEPQAWSDDSDETAIRHALDGLLGQMVGAGPLVLTAESTVCAPIETDGFPLRLALEPQQQAKPKAWGWQPPPTNPWLRLSVERREASGLPEALRWLGPEDANEQAALFLSWQFPTGQPPAGLWHAMSHAIHPSRWAAKQAGVQLRFEDMGNVWSLELQGFADAIPAIVGDLALLLAEPPAASLAQGSRLAESDAALGGDDMLIRQLLQGLPRLLARGALKEGQVETSDRSTLCRYWQTAQWQGLAAGFASALSGPLNDALKALPGAPGLMPIVARTVPEGDLWHDVSGGAAMSETALILFCPLPENSPVCEASWRVLARLIEGDFFRRLRSELQLGYAVFSRFYQAGDQPGMLFGVQSPSASAGEILDHIKAFFKSVALKLADQQAFAVQRSAIEAGERHVAGPADLRARADQIWKCCLAGHEVTRPSQVAAAMRSLRRDDLSAALEALRAATGGWVVVANAPAPEGRWP